MAYFIFLYRKNFNRRTSPPADLYYYTTKLCKDKGIWRKKLENFYKFGYIKFSDRFHIHNLAFMSEKMYNTTVQTKYSEMK